LAACQCLVTGLVLRHRCRLPRRPHHLRHPAYEQHAILWRIVVGFGAVPALIVLLVRRRYLAESPEWLANQGDLRAAVDVMRSHHNLDVELAPVEDRDPTAASAEPVKGGRWSGF